MSELKLGAEHKEYISFGIANILVAKGVITEEELVENTLAVYEAVRAKQREQVREAAGGKDLTDEEIDALLDGSGDLLKFFLGV